MVHVCVLYVESRVRYMVCVCVCTCVREIHFQTLTKRTLSIYIFWATVDSSEQQQQNWN